eukprot:408834_1
MPHFYSLSTVIGAVAGVKLFQNAPNKQDRVVNYIKAFKGKHFNTDRLQHQMSLQVCIADFRSTEKMKDDEDHALNKLISSIEDAECLDELHTSWIQHEKIMADAIDHSSKSEVLILTTNMTECCGQKLIVSGQTTGKIYSFSGSKTAQFVSHKCGCCGSSYQYGRFKPRDKYENACASMEVAMTIAYALKR